MNSLRRISGASLRGVTLIEMAVTIAIVGILAVLVIQFGMPIRSYIDTSRRAALADSADTSLRRIGRDLRLALPNSVRVTGTPGSTMSLELLLVRTGGRYRSAADPNDNTGTCNNGSGTTPANNVLDIGVPDSCFKTLGDLADIGSVKTASDYLVVFNLPPGTTNANAYEFPGTGGNKTALLTAANGSGSERFEFPAAHTFTYESPGQRFFIIEGPVSYVCDPTAGTLTRYSGYTIQSTQPTPSSGAPALTGGNLLTDKVKACEFAYSSTVSLGSGLVTMSLQLKMQDSRGTDEVVSLYHAVHVNNVP